MRIKQQLLFLVFTILFCQNSLASFSDSFTFSNDTIPEVTPIYKGNRIRVKSIEIIKKRGNNVKIKYNLVNTGKNKIKLGKGKVIPRDLIVTFDKSLESNDLTEAKAAIIESLKNQKFSIRPGQLIMSNKMKFSYSSIPPSDRIAKTEDKNEPIEKPISEISSNSIEENLVENTESVAEKIEEVETPKIEEKEVSDPIAEIIETVSEEDNELNLESPRFKNDQDAIVTEKLDETILTKEKESTSQETVLNNNETKVLPSIKEDEVTIEKQDIIIDSENLVETTKEEIIEIKNMETVSEIPIQEEEEIFIKNPNEEIVEIESPEIVIDSLNQAKEETFVEKPLEEFVEIESPEIVIDSLYQVEETLTELSNEENITTDSLNKKSKFDKNLCGDLVLKDVEIIKKNKRYVMVKYTVTNIGNYPIALLGETKKLEDNIAIQAHFTRSNKLTRGSIPVKLTFIKKGLKDKKGILEPNESFSSKLKIEISKMTKFTPVLALSLNPFNITLECSKLNNTIFLNIANQDAPPPADPLPIKPKLEVEEGEEVIGARN